MKKTYYTSSYFSFFKLMFLHFDHFDLTTLRMTLNPQNNTINGFFDQNPMKKRYYTYSQRYLLKMIFSLN